MVVEYKPEYNQLLTKKYWKKEKLKPDEETKLVENNVEEISEKNIKEMRSAKHIDFYLATSMRTPEQYEAGIELYHWLIGQGYIVFPPMFMSEKTRPKQAVLEADMVEKARRGIIAMYGVVDTFGIDSEMVESLKFGKEAYLCLYTGKDTEEQEQNNRYKIFHDIHPRVLIRSDSGLRGPHVMRAKLQSGKPDFSELERCLKSEGTWLPDLDQYTCRSCNSILQIIEPLE